MYESESWVFKKKEEQRSEIKGLQMELERSSTRVHLATM